MSALPGLRDQIISALRSALEPLNEVLAFWEAGSAATGLLDHLSDLDLQLIVRDGAAAAAARAAEAALAQVSPIALRFEVPAPTWHGNWQAFFRLQESSPYLLIDLTILEERQNSRFLEPEMHGVPLVYFDKQGLVKPAPVDPAAFAERLRTRLPLLEQPVALFHAFVDKELERGRPIDAYHFYQGLLMTRLIEALRIRYAPWRHNFGARYLQQELPPELYDQVQSLSFVGSPAELLANKRLLLETFAAVLQELRTLDLERHLRQNRHPAFRPVRIPPAAEE